MCVCVCVRARVCECVDSCSRENCTFSPHTHIHTHTHTQYLLFARIALLPWPQQLLFRQKLFRQQLSSPQRPSLQQPWPLPLLLLLPLPQPWPRQPPWKCPHKSVITKSDLLHSLPGKETGIFSQTSQFSFLLCYRQASKRVALVEKKLGYTHVPHNVRCGKM